MLQNEIKDLILKSLISPLSFFKIISYERPNIYYIHTEIRRGGFGICHVFMGSFAFKQQIYCQFLQMGWVQRSKN